MLQGNASDFRVMATYRFLRGFREDCIDDQKYWLHATDKLEC